MRRILILALLLLVTSLAALQLKGQQGYLLLRVGAWSIETSPSLALIATLLLFLALLYTVRLLLRIIHAPRDLHHWNHRQQIRRARNQLNHGLITLAEGNWKKAEKLLGRSATHSDNPLMHYLGAANAAHHQQADERRDHYLKMAHQQAPKADFVIGLTQAEQQLGHQQYDAALETLNQLRRQRPNHPKLLQLLAKTLTAQQQWGALIKLLPQLQKKGELSTEELQPIRQQAESQRLLAAAAESTAALKQQWKQLPRKERRDSLLLGQYTQLLSAGGDHEESEKLLRKAIERSWSESLVTHYGALETTKTDMQIQHAEKWLKGHSESAPLHHALGALYLRKEVWGQAQHHLKKSLELSPSSESYQLLAQLMKQQGELEGALSLMEREVALLREQSENGTPHNKQPLQQLGYLDSEAPATSKES